MAAETSIEHNKMQTLEKLVLPISSGLLKLAKAGCLPLHSHSPPVYKSGKMYPVLAEGHLSDQLHR